MAPSRAPGKSGKGAKLAKPKGDRKSDSTPKMSARARAATKNRPKISGSQVKSRPSTALSLARKAKGKRRTYTDKELGITPLNKITPAGVKKPTSGKKKGKVFIDDTESMRRILAVVRAEKDKDVEGKIQRERQLEEVREARRLEMERKEAERKAKFEETKDSLRRKKPKKTPADDGSSVDMEVDGIKSPAAIKGESATRKVQKKVSFG